VAQLAKRNTKPTVIITNGLNGPTRLAFDSSNSSDLWVTNTGGSSVAEYDVANPAAPLVVLTQGINRPLAVAVDAQDNVYVGNNSGDSITVYASTGGAPLQTWTSDNQGHQFLAPGAMFLDNPSGTKPELYVAFGPGSQQDSVISYSLSSVLRGPIPQVQRYFTSGISGPTGIWVGQDEKPVYVANFYTSTVVGFYVKPRNAQTIDTQGQPNGVAVRSLDDDIYVAIGDENDILVYSPKGALLKTLQ
jgi:sugar lactone lactonase YvrE